MTRKRILSLYLGFLAALLLGTYLVLRETGVARTFVVNVLSEFLERSRFSLADANFDIGDGIVILRGFEIATPDDNPGRARIAFDRVDVGVDTNPLGTVGRVRSVVIRGMRLECDLVEGRFPDLQGLLRNRAPNAAGSTAVPPPVEVIDSTLVLRLSADAEPIEFTDVQLRLLPEEAGSFECGLSGSMLAPEGRAVTVEGRGDLAKPDFRVVLRLADVPLSPEIALPYDVRAVDFLAGIGIGGRARSIAIWAEYPDSRAPAGSDPEIVAGLRIELEELRCSVPQLPYPIVGASAQVAADLRDLGSLNFVVENHSVNGDIEAHGAVTGLFADDPLVELQVEANDILVGPVLGRALATLPDARSVWDAFRPTGGRADASLRLITSASGARERLSLELQLRGVAAQFVGFEADDGTRAGGFPAPLEQIAGVVRIHEGEIRIEDVSARLGEHEIRLAGQVIPTAGGAPRVELDLGSDEIAFSPQIRDALGVFDPYIAEVYDEYAPEGATALQVQVRSAPGAADAGVRVRLRPLGASAAWSGFPYRVQQVTGLVDIGTDGVFLDLEGARGETSIAVTGRFPNTGEPAAPTDGPAALLRVQASGVGVDDQLRRAMRTLSAALGDTVEFLGLTGSCDVDLTTWRDAGAIDFGYDVRVDVDDGAIQLENLPLPTRGLQGPIFVHGDGIRSRVEVASVHGSIDNGPDRPPAKLILHGTVETVDGDYATDLSAVIRKLDLNERLGRAVDQFGAFDFDTWTMLRPSGGVDVVWRQTKQLGEPNPHQVLRMQLLDARSAAEFLPAPAEAIYGDLLVVDGVARFSDVRARMAGASVQCAEGSAVRDGDRSIFEAVVSSDDFPVDDRLANLLDGPLKRTYLDRQVRGRVSLHSLRMKIEMPDVGQPRTEFRGRLSSLGLRIVLGTEIQDLTGLWTIDHVEVGPDTGMARGHVEAGGFSVFDHRVSDVKASFYADTERVEFSGIQSRLHGGTLRGRRPEAALVYRLAAPGELSFDLGWDGVSLDQLARASGVRDERFRGRLSGHLLLNRMAGTDIVDSVGEGELRVTEGDMGQVPVFTAIYSYLLEPRRPRFENLLVDFSIRDRKIDIPKLEISSPLLTATGRGQVDMDGYVDMRIDFPDFFGKSADWLFLPQVLRMLTSELAQFQVYGYVRAPRIRPLWLWRDAARRVALGPIPAAPARPATTSTIQNGTGR